MIILLFGVVIFGLFSKLNSPDLNLVSGIQVGLGLFLLLLFFIRGGLQALSSGTARRVGSFGVGVIIYSGLYLGLLALGNYFIYRHDPLHIDTTEQKIHTLAPQTLSVLKKLSSPVIIRAFFVGGEIDDKLENLLNRLCRQTDLLSWKMIDPEKHPELTEKYGINEKGTLHFSFAAQEAGSKEAKISREIDEQEVVNALIRLIRPKENILYYSSGHGETDLMDGTSNTGGMFLREAIQGEGVKVEKLLLAEAKQVPDDASALLISAPRRLFMPQEKEAVINYLTSGGSVIFLNEANITSDIADLVRPLGIEVGKDIIIEKSAQMMSAGSYDAQSIISNYGQHPITKGFHQATIFPTSSSVRRAPNLPPEIHVTELAKTSKDSWAESKPQLVFSENPEAALEEDDLKGPVSIAAAFEGVIARKDSVKARLVPDDMPRKSRVVVFGDADFITNVHLRQLYNRDFFLNALNWVLGEDDVVTIRASTMRRSTKTLSDRQLRSIFLATAIIIPELLMLLGFILWWRRSS